ncbi:MAG: peptide deformylase [Clostridia bacterium]|nr:peptide deformylase [Clostridia bacterium]MBR3273038.1 peptide deformylase [Clostridia bacterium]
MIRPIVRDTFFLGQKSDPATTADRAVGRDLRDTLAAHRSGCVGMAANMIGVKKRVIVVSLPPADLVMYNPAIVLRDTPYEAEEGCLSLDGTRRATRYQNITVEYRDEAWQKRRQRYSGWIAQIIQHELDHLEGIVI